MMAVAPRANWLLGALAASNGDPLTPVQVQKVMFLLDKRAPSLLGKGFYQFRPHNYGPFSAEIYKDLEALEREGLVRVDTAEPGRSWPVYSATGDGIRAAEAWRSNISPQAWAFLRGLVQWARSLTFQQLVMAIYRAYPEQRANSIFVG